MNKNFSLIVFVIIISTNILFISKIAISNENGVKGLSEYELAKIFSIENYSERLNALKKIYSHSEEHGKFLILPIMCKTAILAKQYALAKKYGENSLTLANNYIENWNYGNVIHDANMTLGMVTLHEKNINEAKKYLIKAGNTTATPQLISFGPDLMLAKAFLDINEKKVVKEYFVLLKKIWKNDDGQLDNWISILNKGAIPYLGNHIDK